MDIVSYFVAENYFYSSVKQYLETEANIVAGVVERFYEESGRDYAEEIRSAVEEFEKKDYAELMAVNTQGKVVLSSSGFTPASDYYMPDYDEARISKNGTGYFVGRLDSLEKYMAFTILHPSSGNAIRIVTSLDRVDGRIIMITLTVISISVGIILMLLVMGMYFIRSIVLPILQVGKTADKLAKGDFSVRLTVDRNDEIGELCSVFNYMADELGNTEKMKNEFISSVSHELRTPLTAIKGWSETLTDIDDAETRRKGLKIITKETERLSQMVEELLDFSRIQNGRLSLQKDYIDIIAELADAALFYGERARNQHIALNFEETEDIAVVYGDKNRLRQVFINVIDNAIKYGKENGSVNISTVKKQGRIMISIADDGCGISAADLPRIKEKFFKANNTVRGSGIGLAVADEIIKLHDGSLDIKSKQNVGTEVIITLPLSVRK